MSSGALSRDPKFTLATDLNGLLAQRNDPKNAANRAQISTAIAAARRGGQTATPQAPQSTYKGVTQDSYNALNNNLNQITSNGAYQNNAPQIQQFNPGDFSQTQNDAYSHAMNQFDTTNQQAFDKQTKDFQQRGAVLGLDPTSQGYSDAYKMQVTQPQQQARQQAENSAYTQGLAAQNQGYQQSANTYGTNLQAQGQQFGQGVTNYMTPYNALQYLDPFYRYQTGYQMQNDQNQFTGGQNDLNRSNAVQIAQIGASAAGKGKLSYDQQLGLQNNSALNNYLLNNGGQQQPTSNNGFSNGLTQGTSAFIGQYLAK